VWYGEMPFKEAFSVLYGTACDKNAPVATNLVSDSGSIKWDVSFIRAAHNWEVDVLASFFTLLYSISVSRKREDQLWWFPVNKWIFDVRSYYKILACKKVASALPLEKYLAYKGSLESRFFYLISSTREDLYHKQP
jgi:hypothetical protein